MCSVKLSVCITTYKRPAGLVRTLRSLAAQTRQPDELIISDDCSPSDPSSIVEQWRETFPRLIFNRNATNLYMPGNLNASISLATGEYIANLHDADEFDPTLLEKWERALDRFPSAGFVFCGLAGLLPSKQFPDGVSLIDAPPLTSGQAFYETYMRHRFDSVVWGTVMARRSAYEHFLPFDATYGFISDVDMWLRMCLIRDVAYVREPLIILDNSPTKERSFDWRRVETMRRMQLAHLHRFYDANPWRLRRELVVHAFVTQTHYGRWLLGRVRHRNWPGLREGISACRTVGWPLRALGYLPLETRFVADHRPPAIGATDRDIAC